MFFYYMLTDFIPTHSDSKRVIGSEAALQIRPLLIVHPMLYKGIYKLTNGHDGI